MGNNRFTARPNAENEFPNEINEDQLIIDYLKNEFPNDSLLNSNQLTTNNISIIVPAVPADKLARRNKEQILEVDADVSASYAEYTINKLVPSINDDDLDEYIDDEFEFFVSIAGSESTIPVADGLFLVAVELGDNTIDYHDRYIRFGPHTIADRINAGELFEEIIATTFCVWFIQNNVALPIPDYKTLEVLLVERNKTYNTIFEAAPDDFDLYDLRLDGKDIINPNGRGATPHDEFVNRQTVSKAHLWNYQIRFKSGYAPGIPYGSDESRPFFRDPGDYLKPTQQRRPELKRRQLISADPGDLYYDTVFLQQDQLLELDRSRYEGRLVVRQWPQPFSAIEVSADTEGVRFDDLIFDVRFMIYGHWKQVIDINLLSQIARERGVPLSNYDPNLRLLTPPEIINSLTTVEYEALANQNGIINAMVENGVIEVLNAPRLEDTILGERSPWSDFPHIAEADRLDLEEYNTYRDYQSNNLNIFGLDYLQLYEPAGSVTYYLEYDPIKYQETQEQAFQQNAIDNAKALLEETLPSLSAKISELQIRFKNIPPSLVNYVNANFGPRAPLHSILYHKQDDSKTQWKLGKQKNNGAYKEVNTQRAFFRLCEKGDKIFAKMNKNEENAIFYEEGRQPYYHINIKQTDDQFKVLGTYNIDDDVRYVLIDDDMVEAAKDANGSGGDFSLKTPNRYQMPRGGGGGRQNRLLNEPDYFRLSIANYIFEAIITRTANMPNNIISANNALNLWERCEEANSYITRLGGDIEVLAQEIADLDSRIITADTVDEFIVLTTLILDLKTEIANFDFETFDYIEQLVNYIDRNVVNLVTNITKSIQYVRQKVFDETEGKYYIVVPSFTRQLIQNILRSNAPDFGKYLPDQPTGADFI
jgi:hypothetical protein